MADTATVTEIPDCQLCAGGGLLGLEPRKQEQAVVDGKTKSGPWAYMCEAHWKSDGVGRLGTGFGQRLVLADG